MRRTPLPISLATALGALLTGGCVQKDLTYEETLCRVDVRFDWERAPEASPEGMTVLFFPLSDGGDLWRFEISGREGGAVEITPGDYTMIALNNDLPDLRLHPTTYSSACVMAKESLRAAPLTSPTGILYGGKCADLTITRDMAITCLPDTLSTLYDITVEIASGMDRVRKVEGRLTGCASGLYLADDRGMPPAVTIPLDMAADLRQSLLTGSTTGFPYSPGHTPYELTLRVGYKEGGAYEKSFDISSQAANPPYPHHVNIVLKDVALPAEPNIDTDEVGVRVDVDGWRAIEINYDSTNL